MADHHHRLHIPPSSDFKLGAQHQRRPTKALIKILSFVSKHVAGRVAVALGGARAVLLDLLSKTKAGVELRRKTKRKRRGMDYKDRPCFCGGCVEMHLNLLPPSWTSSSSPWPETTTTAVMEPLEAGLYCSYYDPSWNTVIPAELQLPYCSYYDPSWNTVIPAELQLPPIARYLEWADEEHQMEDDEEEDGASCDEIDSLAERFIARCHERFMLEKQESYRRYQEMLARSL